MTTTTQATSDISLNAKNYGYMIGMVYNHIMRGGQFRLISDTPLYLSDDDQVDAIVTNHEELHQYLDSISA